MTTKFILPDDVDIKTALDMLEIFKTCVNNLIILDNVIMPDGKVLVKGGAIHNLLVDIINCQKRLRLDKAYDENKDGFHLSAFNKSVEVTENQYTLLKGFAENYGMSLRGLLDQIITSYMIKNHTKQMGEKAIVRCVFKLPTQVKPIEIELELQDGNRVKFGKDWFYIPSNLKEPYYFRIDKPIAIAGTLDRENE
ncbi:MAG: hypothetical protein WC389_18815 [Lutibacter sp.]|jgi:transcription elongation factor GreA-like protein